MRLPKFRYAILSGALLGFLIPLVCEAQMSLGIYIVPWKVELFIWPSSRMFRGEDVFGLQALAILAWSIAWNVLFYVALFILLWSLGWVFRAWRASLRDGTTI